MNTYKYETHFHTQETSFCGKVKAKDGVRLYHSSGYTGIAVTDHYTREFFESRPSKKWRQKVDSYLKGYRNALAEGRKLKMDILLGIEIRFDENYNDYLVYGFDENFLYENEELYKLSLVEFRELTLDSEIIIVQAHPFRTDMIPMKPPLIDGIESYNGNPRHNSANHLAKEYAVRYNLKTLSGSDFHQPQDLAKGGIIINKRVNPVNCTKGTTKEFVNIFKEDRILEHIQN